MLDKMAIDAPISIYAFAKTESSFVIQYNAVCVRYYYPSDDRYLAVEIGSIYEASGTAKLDNWAVVYDFVEKEWHFD